MLASITKRDGTEVPFDSVIILNAITKANQAVGGEEFIHAQQAGDDAQYRHHGDIGQ